MRTSSYLRSIRPLVVGLRPSLTTVGGRVVLTFSRSSADIWFLAGSSSFSIQGISLFHVTSLQAGSAACVYPVRSVSWKTWEQPFLRSSRHSAPLRADPNARKIRASARSSREASIIRPSTGLTSLLGRRRPAFSARASFILLPLSQRLRILD